MTFSRIATLERGDTLPTVRGRCRVCDEALTGRQRAYCGKACSDLYKLATNTGFLRFKTFERDHGICAECEIDCDSLEVRVWGYSTNIKRPWRLSKSQLVLPIEQRTLNVQALRDNGWTLKSYHPRTLWAADHIEPLADGGAFDLGNVQTLCLLDHTKKTSDEATWRAKRRKVLGKKQTETMRRFKKMGLV